MSFCDKLEESMRALDVKLPPETLTDEARARLERMALASPLYAKQLVLRPAQVAWLENPHNRDVAFRRGTFMQVWRKDFPGPFDNEEQELNALRRFRRLMSMRIAYREINGLSSLHESLAELTWLAEFCLEYAYRLVYMRYEAKFGTPWDEEEDQEARFCVMALGKMGGGELNFCSDIDLIYFYLGEGNCRKNGKATHLSNGEFFTRVGRDMGNLLNKRTADGFLYNIDLRLRPEGETGPLVRSFSGMENYYYVGGQTWERLALIKARPVAGDLNLGHELFEVINAFRYPRHPPQSIVEEVAGVKIRIEKEVLGEEALQRNVKNGYGGIREIEFFAQTLQLLNAGHNPFLQTPKTLEALEKLERYNLVDRERRRFLVEAYSFLRLVENRLQMREEKQTHELPKPGAQLDDLARSFGMEPDAFQAKLDEIREAVRANYRELFKETDYERRIVEWTMLLSGEAPSEGIQRQLVAWFGEVNAKDAPETFRQFVRGGPHHHLTREQVILFHQITGHFDSILPKLAHPQRTLKRLAAFAESYHARKQLLKTCSNNPGFLLSLCLLFDCSEFIHKLLCRHPEIMEEVLLTQVRREKDLKTLRHEISLLPQDESLPRYLWLYVKAEQVRYAVAERLGHMTDSDTEKHLTLLADAALAHALEKFDPGGELAAFALGKYGGAAMAFGSDLDIIVFGRDPGLARLVPKIRKVLGHKEVSGPTFDVDLRLRPHGKDGPLVVTPGALERYHAGRGAQVWERQMLTRARFVAGNTEVAAEVQEMLRKIMYDGPLPIDAARQIWRMRGKIEREKVRSRPAELYFKSGPGGLVDIEFFCQTTQLDRGYEIEDLQWANTRTVLRVLAASGEVARESAETLLENYNFLRRLELYLRREINDSVDKLSDHPDQCLSIAKWLEFSDYGTFWKEHTRRMAKTREIVAAELAKRFPGLDWQG